MIQKEQSPALAATSGPGSQQQTRPNHTAIPSHAQQQEREARISALLSTLEPLVRAGLRDNARRVFAQARKLIGQRSAATIAAMEDARGLR